MKSTRNERIQKSAAAASSNAPSQIVRRPIPALAQLIAATHHSALLPTAATSPKLPTEPDHSPTVMHKKDNPITMDTKFPVSQHKAKRSTSVIPETEHCGESESKQHVGIPGQTFNPWTAEAFSIFEGKLHDKIYIM